MGQNKHFDIDHDGYDSWGHEVRVTDPTHTIVLIHYETGSLPLTEVVGTYEEGGVNESVAKNVIRWAKE